MPEDQSRGTWVRATGALVSPGRWGQAREERPTPSSHCLARAEEVRGAVGIKESFGDGSDETSWTICESHSSPQKHA